LELAAARGENAHALRLRLRARRVEELRLADPRRPADEDDAAGALGGLPGDRAELSELAIALDEPGQRPAPRSRGSPHIPAVRRLGTPHASDPCFAAPGVRRNAAATGGMLRKTEPGASTNLRGNLSGRL